MSGHVPGSAATPPTALAVDAATAAPPFWERMRPASKRLIVTAPRYADADGVRKTAGGLYVPEQPAYRRRVHGIAARVLAAADDVTVAAPGEWVVIGEFDGIPLGGNVEVDAWIIVEGAVQGVLPPDYVPGSSAAYED